MNSRHTTSNHATARRRRRRIAENLRRRRCALCCALLAALLAVAPEATPAQAASAAVDTAIAPAPTARMLQLAGIELEGATRTSRDVVLERLPLRIGQPIDQATLVAAVERLREAALFRSVDFYTKPGAERGQVILVLEVAEHGADFRWAAGNTNLDGWYLSPAMLAWENFSGRADRLDLQWRIGFRHHGLLLRYDRPPTPGGRDYWGARLSIMDTDRPYFFEGIEYRHPVGVSRLAGVFGRHLGRSDLAEVGLALETVDVADHAYAHNASEDGSVEFDQEIPAADLPAPIAGAVGRVNRAIVHLDWQHDTRAARLRAGTPVGGAWGRLKSHAVLQDGRSHAGLQADLRLYREVPGGVLAARLRGALVGREAAFHDRLYLGGMYSVRGFATHSLSAPGGDTWLWSGSLEYRSSIIVDSRGDKLTGLFFLDAGAAGSPDAGDPYSGVAVGAGYGIRWRVWWLDRVGLDVGFPLTDHSPDARFQATASIGWSF